MTRMSASHVESALVAEHKFADLSKVWVYMFVCKWLSICRELFLKGFVECMCGTVRYNLAMDWFSTWEVWLLIDESIGHHLCVALTSRFRVYRVTTVVLRVVRSIYFLRIFSRWTIRRLFRISVAATSEISNRCRGIDAHCKDDTELMSFQCRCSVVHWPLLFMFFLKCFIDWNDQVLSVHYQSMIPSLGIIN